MSEIPAIELIGIDKKFGAVHANKSIDLSVARGSIHGIIGENGAGKSTLMSIIYGFYQADSGTIRVGGTPVTIKDSQAAIAAGIGMVHQHFMLVENFTVLENIMLGAEGGALLARGAAAARDALAQLARDYGLEVDPDAVIEELPVGLQQRVEILKAMYRGAEILILDEPTGVLTPAEADHLFKILGVLRDQGKTVLLITHKLREIMAITDMVSVMRRGEMVATRKTAETTVEELAELMVGRRVLLQVDKQTARPGAVALSVRNLTVKDNRGVTMVNDVSFDLHAGEILGIAGVAGNGQSELLEAIAGIRKPVSGTILIGGKPVSGLGPAALRRIGLAHIPEDRHHMGLVLSFEESENAILGYHRDPAYGSGPFLDPDAVRRSAAVEIERYDIRPPNPRLKTANFSGGNQQKIVVAREIERDPEVLIIGQPTRGVDIGAIEFIHRRIIETRDAGKAILLVSVELDEIRALSDRIMVMFAGRVVGEKAPDAGEQTIGLMMAGIAVEDDMPAELLDEMTDTIAGPDPAMPADGMAERPAVEIAAPADVIAGSGDAHPDARAEPIGTPAAPQPVAIGEKRPVRIFISYRRGDAGGFAGRIYDRLEVAFGRDNLFFDVDNIAPGADFVDVLQSNVDACDVLLALIGPDWVNAQTAEGRRRLHEPGDFVRIEIQRAIEGKIVIPVLLDNALMPASDDLPASLQSLIRRQAVRISHESFRSDMERLIKHLREMAARHAVASKVSDQEGRA